MLLGALPLDPYTIFARARSHWSAQAYPSNLSYLVIVSGTASAGTMTNTYESSVNTETGKISVRAASREEAAHPYVPRGLEIRATVNISYAGKAPHAPSANPQGVVGISKTMRVSKMQQYDLLGVPVLSPTYGFGLAIESRAPPSAAPVLPGGLKTIAAVAVAKRDYEVRYDGDEDVHGTRCYHLQLRPLHDPQRYRLRDLWVAQDTYAPQQALIQGNFTEGPSPRLPWLIRFSSSAGLTYIADETAQSPVKYLGRTYTNVAITFRDIEPLSTPNVLSALSMFRTSGDILIEPSAP